MAINNADRVRDRAEQHGRDPASIKILVAMAPVVAPTETQAQETFETIRAHGTPEGTKALFGGWTDIDLSQFDPDQPLEHIETEGMQTMVDFFTTADPEREWTIRDIQDWMSVGSVAFNPVGTPEQVADEMERWFREGDVDGFNILPTYAPGSFREFAELVVPELQRRGLFREEYRETTLRERYAGSGVRRLPRDHPGRRYSVYS